MRHWTRLLPLLLAGLATGAGAIPSPIDGTLRIRLASASGSDVLVSGSFSAAALAPHLSSLTVPASVFQTANQLVDLTDVAPPIFGLKATLHNLVGSFGDTGGGFGGVMGLAGLYRTCLFADCNAAFVPANLSLPLAVVGAAATSHRTTFINITVIGAPWTTGTVNVGAFTQMGFVHAPGSGTSSTGLTGGVVSLVTPVFVSTSIPGGTAFMPLFGLLTLRVVPEPATSLLVAGDLVALGLGGRRLRKR